MKTKRDQHKVGSKTKPRGQQMGVAGKRDQNREQKNETPALSGRRKSANKMFGDRSTANVGGDAVTMRSNSPSTPGMNSSKRSGESGGETGFKRRLQKTRAARKP